MDFSGAVKSPMPREVKPMLATLIDAPFDGENWAFEIKWDGYRSLLKSKKARSACTPATGSRKTRNFPRWQPA